MLRVSKSFFPKIHSHHHHHHHYTMSAARRCQVLVMRRHFIGNNQYGPLLNLATQNGTHQSEEESAFETIADDKLPQWFLELKNSVEIKELSKTYEISWFNEAKSKPFIWNDIIQYEQNDKDESSDALWHFARQLTGSDKNILSCGRDRKYIHVGTGIGFPDYRDIPMYFSTLRSSNFWLDPQSLQPKILFQFNRCFPPLFWIPLKPSPQTLKRLFEEFIQVETNTLSKHMQTFDQMLTEIGFDKNSKNQDPKLHKKMLKHINNMNPKRINDDKDHENTCTFFMGNIEDVKTMETHFMNNPFIFNTPILLGSSNKYYSGRPIIHSMFRTVYSRSVITLETRCDLYSELGDQSKTEKDKVLPVFVKINYPSNKLISRPIPARVNKIFGTQYPEDMPVDVIAALFGNSLQSVEQMRSNFLSTANEELVHARQFCTIAHLAVLRDEQFMEIFDRFSNHSNPLYRLACLKGASELGWNDKIEQMKKNEKSVDLLERMEQLLENVKQELEIAKSNQIDDEDEKDVGDLWFMKEEKKK